MRTADVPLRPPLTRDQSVDVCVVGAGIAGLTTAYELLTRGQSVVVLDDGPIGGGQTQRTTAHLTNAIDDRYVNIEAWHGAEGARLAAASHMAAIDEIERIVAREWIPCEFERVDGYLFAPPGRWDKLLVDELQAARRAGVIVESEACLPLSTFASGPCLRFPRQGQFHPLKYLLGLAHAILKMGGQIYSSTRVTSYECGPPVCVKTESGVTVTAAHLVVATNTPFNDWVTIHTKQAPYLTYALAFAVPRGSVPRALYWDTETPYHYVRVEPLNPDDAPGDRMGDSSTEDLLIVGGEDHKTGQADDAEKRYDALEAWACSRFPISRVRRCQWSGQVFETIDGLAFIGRNPLDGPNVYIATGDSGQGMTHGTIAGMLLSDLITGRENPWASLYDPARKTVGAATRYLQENVNVAVQYTDWLTSGDVSSTDEIRSGSGAVVRSGLTKVAAYRDESGALHECSAICPHLGCVVHWNHGEHTWDCPCHGSRFDCHGHLLIGPANVDLSPVDHPTGHVASTGPFIP
jgi:glycine/D-amino acid oxidase-like deaminating enzyme/nitrite reductase/ring-hydroxylating ferredoxin subunit